MVDTMQFRVDAVVPRGLPPKAAARFSRLGYGGRVKRSDVVQMFGKRAGDQFINTWARRGLLVPAGWGAYVIPNEQTFLLALSARSSAHAQLVAWAATARTGSGPSRRLAWMAPVIWDRTTVSIEAPSPLFPLRPEDTVLRPQVPQLESFAADLGWPLEPLEIRVGDLGRVRSQAVSAADVGWILRLNKDPRIRQAGSSLIASLSPHDRNRAQDIARLAAFPAWTPTRSSPLALPLGPPRQFRLFGPPWFMRPHQRALEAEDRRSGRA